LSPVGFATGLFFAAFFRNTLPGYTGYTNCQNTVPFARVFRKRPFRITPAFADCDNRVVLRSLAVCLSWVRFKKLLPRGP